MIDKRLTGQLTGQGRGATRRMIDRTMIDRNMIDRSVIDRRVIDKAGE